MNDLDDMPDEIKLWASVVLAVALSLYFYAVLP